MPAAFAALEARVATAVSKRLSNCAGTIAGASFEGIFDAAPQVSALGDAGIAADMPQIAMLTSYLPVAPYGAAVVVSSGQGVGSYTVKAYRVDGDWSVVELQKA